MRPTCPLRCTIAALALCAGAGAATAAPPKEALVTRESQDLYRAGSGAFYIKTINCHEQIYGDRVNLRMNIGVRGGMMILRSGRSCVIEKFLREVDPNTMQLRIEY